jgi:hypothetical protein
MTEVCWQRLQEIIERHCEGLTTLSILSTDPRIETHQQLLQSLLKLPENGLKELNLSNVNVELLGNFLKRQKTVKNLSITGNLDDHEILNDFKLTKLKIVGPKTRKLAEIIKSQPDLTSLKITTDKETEYDAEVFRQIVKLSKLESLDVPILKTFDNATVKSLQQLRNLKKISVSCDDLCIQSLISTSIPSLQQLDINFEDFVPPHFIATLSRNFPSLIVVKFRGSLVSNFLNDVPIHLPNLESLWLINVESFFVNVLTLQSFEVNTRLRNLFVVNHDRKVVICANDLVRFVKKFPQLQTLVLTKFIDIQLCDFEAILKHLPELREIAIDSKCIESTIKVMSLVGNHGRKLQYVRFENFKHASNKESLMTFFDGKFAVIEKVDGNLVMRQREKSFLGRVMD